jgi:hypothetical protein
VSASTEKDMTLFRNIKDRFSGVLKNSRGKVSRLRKNLNEELQIYRLKKQLETLKREHRQSCEDAGRKLSDLFVKEPENISAAAFSGDCQYIQGLEKRIRDTESRLGELFSDSLKSQRKEKENSKEIELESDQSED